jgi:hypothetical protein
LQIVNLWRAAATHVSSLEYGQAAELIGGMEHMTEAFYRLSEEVGGWEQGGSLPQGALRAPALLWEASIWRRDAPRPRILTAAPQSG